MKRLLCKFLKHRFESHQNSAYKRKCVRCDREEWLMIHHHPRIGEPGWRWQYIPYDKLHVLKK